MAGGRSVKLLRYVSRQHIYFDGALPQSKFATRLERLEKARAQLVKWRDITELQPIDTTVRLEQKVDIEKVLWQNPSRSTSTSSVSVRIPPAAPFIVPSVLEHLRKTKWTAVTMLVPGEADLYCAAAAAALITSQNPQRLCILTNDSDLVLYSATRDAHIVLLHTLGLDTSKGSSDTLKAQCWHPGSNENQLNLKSMLTLGFERSLDSTASFSEVLQRAKLREAGQVNTIHDTSWEAFRKEYETDSVAQSAQILDPRLNELVVQLEVSRQLGVFHVYLPLLHEDPQRASSWQYGSEYRQLAYSVLAHHFSRADAHETSISEFARSGSRIVATQIPVLSQLRRDQLEEELEQSLSASIHATTTTSVKFNNSPTLDFYLFALKTVLSAQNHAGRVLPTFETLEHLLGLHSPNRRPKPTTTSSKPRRLPKPQHNLIQAQLWSLFHLNANIQAALYSLRLLKQAMTYINVHSGVRISSHTIESIWSSMPDIPDLFVNHPAELRAKFARDGVTDDTVRDKLAAVLRGLSDGIEQQQRQQQQHELTSSGRQNLAASQVALSSNINISNNNDNKNNSSKRSSKKRKKMRESHTSL